MERAVPWGYTMERNKRMIAVDDWSPEVTLVFDPTFADSIEKLVSCIPIWIVMSAANEPKIREWWAGNPGSHYRSGITGFRHSSESNTERRFLELLESIELHHGVSSFPSPYTSLNVIGMPFTEVARSALSDIGFSKFTPRQTGFSAVRSDHKGTNGPS